MAHHLFLYAESGVIVLFVILIIKVDFTRRDIIFDLSDYLKSSDFRNQMRISEIPYEL